MKDATTPEIITPGATRARDWAIGAVLVLVTFGLFARALRFDFIHSDDPEYVFRNDHV